MKMKTNHTMKLIQYELVLLIECVKVAHESGELDGEAALFAEDMVAVFCDEEPVCAGACH